MFSKLYKYINNIKTYKQIKIQIKDFFYAVDEPEQKKVLVL